MISAKQRSSPRSSGTQLRTSDRPVSAQSSQPCRTFLPRRPSRVHVGASHAVGSRCVAEGPECPAVLTGPEVKTVKRTKFFFYEITKDKGTRLLRSLVILVVWSAGYHSSVCLFSLNFR